MTSQLVPLEYFIRNTAEVIQMAHKTYNCLCSRHVILHIKGAPISEQILLQYASFL